MDTTKCPKCAGFLIEDDILVYEVEWKCVNCGYRLFPARWAAREAVFRDVPVAAVEA